MPNLAYNRDIPDAPNNPSVDQPKMKDNTNSTDTLIAVDHYSFNDNLGGLHKQVVMPLRGGGTGSIPPGLVAGEGALYTKTVNAATQLFYSPDASGNEYQLTEVITASFSTFGTNTFYNGGFPRVQGGWTYLPGGLLLQYGFLTSPVNNDTIPFAVPFNGAAFVTLGGVRSDTTDKVISVKDGSVSNTQFQVILSGSSLPTGLYWQAIGIK